MKTLIKKSHLAIAALSALAITACGVGGGLAGIGGSGYISTGTVTSFGSVFVNGVEFETDASTFEIEDASGTQADLRIGMVVEVTGSINADGITGNATNIKYGDDLQGPVTNLNAGANVSSFEIFGNVVEVSSVSTAFEDVTFATIAEGNVLEVSGFYDQNNVLQASYIAFKSASANADSIVEIKGRISNLSLDLSNFEIQGVTVNAAGAIFEDLPDGLQNNLFVEVKGKLNNNIINATEIESEDSFSEETGVELEGIVTRYNNISDFDVNDQTVDATNANLSPANLVLNVGDKVEINGQLSNGVFIASEVETREGSAGVSAIVSEVNIDTNSFTVEVLPGQLITVQLTTATRMKDEKEGEDENLLITELNADVDFVSVQGFESASDTITATEIKRESEVKATELEGVATDGSDSGFIVLGVTYPVDINTSYSDVEDNAAFLELLSTLNEPVISISDETPDDGIADSVEIEDD